MFAAARSADYGNMRPTRCRRLHIHFLDCCLPGNDLAAAAAAPDIERAHHITRWYMPCGTAVAWWKYVPHSAQTVVVSP
jgi:hypothetical protein